MKFTRLSQTPVQPFLNFTKHRLGDIKQVAVNLFLISSKVREKIASF